MSDIQVNPSLDSQGFQSVLGQTQSPTQPTATFPMSSKEALRIFRHLLSDYEAEEILSFPTIYYMRTEAKETTKPRKRAPDITDKNHGYDNKDGEYICDLKDSIAYRYEIIKRIGKGSFGQVFECKDHKTQETVALKILKNEDRLAK